MLRLFSAILKQQLSALRTFRNRGIGGASSHPLQPSVHEDKGRTYRRTILLKGHCFVSGARHVIYTPKLRGCEQKLGLYVNL